MYPHHSFLFDSLGSKQPNTARKVHIRRLFDVLHLSIQRNDYERARRAWAILVRCKETHWKTMWSTALLLMEEHPEKQTATSESRVKLLATMMIQRPEERETILKELVLRLIQSGQYRKALDELELYLPSLPYQDNPVLHVYAGLTCVYLAQPRTNDEDGSRGGIEGSWDTSLLREAQAHLERAKVLDPENAVATAFLDQLPTMASGEDHDGAPDSDSDNEDMGVEDADQRRKRTRT